MGFASLLHIAPNVVLSDRIRASFLVPRVNTNIGTTPFSVAAPTLRYMLPFIVGSVEKNAKSRRHLKACLYNLFYNSSWRINPPVDNWNVYWF